jgi:hypothetical protein
MPSTYEIGATGENITCLDCGFTSWNENDVRERYCGNCHEFHGIKQMAAEVEAEIVRLCREDH